MPTVTLLNSSDVPLMWNAKGWETDAECQGVENRLTRHLGSFLLIFHPIPAMVGGGGWEEVSPGLLFSFL